MAVTRYVDPQSPGPASPYLSWATAATNIQDAVNASANGDLVLVSNGVYRTGGAVAVGGLSNRLAITKSVRVESVNGPEVTSIEGNQVAGTINGDEAVRCVFATNGSVLVGFTLTKGATGVSGWSSDTVGGGIWSSGGAIVSNCVIRGNSAYQHGAGAYGATLLNCWLTQNTAGEDGGGAIFCNLSNCVLAGNSAGGSGGGAYGGILVQCHVTNNTANSGGGYANGTATNCTLVGNLALSQGGGSDGGVLYDCRLIGNATSVGGGGGGTWYGTLFRCLLAGNWSYGGGGTYAGNLNNCVLRGNTAEYGGGAMDSTLRNCTITENVATNGGGTYSGTAINCIIYGNIASSASNYLAGNLYYCCTSPLPLNGGGGYFTNAPLFVDQMIGDFRLRSNSPCINSGITSSAPSGTDLDGNPRVAGGTVDVGAYEFPSPASIISYGWLQQFSLPTDGSADYADDDVDGMNNWQEWRSSTVPVDAQSVFKVVSVAKSSPGTKVSWQSVATRLYFLQRGTSFGVPPIFQTIATNVAGATGTKTYSDVTATNVGPYFYRVGVQ